MGCLVLRTSAHCVPTHLAKQESYPLNCTPNSASLHPKSWRQCAEGLSFQDHLQELEGPGGGQVGFAGWVPAHEAGALRPRGADGRGQRQRSSAKTGVSSAFRSTVGQEADRREVPHPEAFSSLSLFRFSVFSLLFQTCLFLLRSSQLLHTSICLRTTVRPGGGLPARGTHQSPSEQPPPVDFCWEV